jgi:hypothetical protein
MLHSSRPKSRSHPGDCDCAFCGNDKDFVIPDHLLEAICNEDVVLFAGAGISTENRQHCQSTFYEEVQAELGFREPEPFPELMDRYCSQPDGRIKLLKKIKNRIDYFSSFPRFYYPMTRFHRALGPLHMLKDVVTTNWDDFFERECDIDAFTYDSDLVFWDASNRRLMKIHGSISNFGSIVATTADYRRSYNRLNKGPLGAHLKSLLARKTVVYVGYSLSDENYLRLLKNIARMMGTSIKHSYFVAPNIDKKRLESAPVPLIPIETDGSYFLEVVGEKLRRDGKVISEDVFDFCDELRAELAKAHNKTADAFLKTQHPALIFVLSYQDGLLHALQRIARRRKTGEYHSPDRVHSLFHGYELKVRQYDKDPWNAAYARGYQNGMLLLLLQHEALDADLAPPIFDLPFPSRVRSLPSAMRFPRSKLPRRASAQAKRILHRKLGSRVDLIPDHTPYL